MQTTDRETTTDVETPKTSAEPLPHSAENAPNSAPETRATPGELRTADGDKPTREGKGAVELKAVAGKAGSWLKASSKKAGAWLKTASRKAGGWLKAASAEKEGEAASRDTSGAGKALSRSWGVVRSRLKPVFIDYPRRAYARFEKQVPSRQTRQAIAGGAAVLVLAVAGFLLWPDSDGALVPEPGEEVCEFLARPAAKLFIDGELVTGEIPPIYETKLAVGKHAVRFVSPDEKTHETEIDVIAGKPSRWFMSFVENRLYERASTAKEEAK